MPQFDIIFLGLSITSSWGNGHATTYRGLVRELTARGHRVLFLERDVPWYADNRDLPQPPFCETALYTGVDDLSDRFSRRVREADVVIVGSFVPEGAEVGRWVLSRSKGVAAFYDIDTPVTMAKLERGDCEYLTPQLVSQYDLYLSFTGGPALRRIEEHYGSPCVRPLYCSVDPSAYFPEQRPSKWDLGYLGTYGADRQPALETLLCEPARCWPQGRFIVAGPMYPDSVIWPPNVERVEHLAPSQHRAFYTSQRFTLNVTRADMVRSGYSPSVRLFEAAACGVPIISDHWPGLTSFFQPGREILIAESSAESLQIIRETTDRDCTSIGSAARRRVLAEHTAAHRAAELERHLVEVAGTRRSLHLRTRSA